MREVLSDYARVILSVFHVSGACACNVYQALFSTPPPPTPRAWVRGSGWDRLSSPCLKRLRHKSIIQWARSQFTRTWLGNKSKLRSIADSPEQDICQRLQSDRWREGEPGDISILLINLDTCRQYHCSITDSSC